jgi:hypothetical protein
MVKPVCVQPIGWPLRRFWRCDCFPQTLARSDLPLAASGGAKLIAWHVCAHNDLLPLAGGHNGGIPSGIPISENPSGVTKKSAAAVVSPAASASASLALQVTAGLEAKVLCFSSDLFS